MTQELPGSALRLSEQKIADALATFGVRKVCRFLAFENPSRVHSDLPITICEADPVTH
jgi:hypothetical protein